MNKKILFTIAIVAVTTLAFLWLKPHNKTAENNVNSRHTSIHIDEQPNQVIATENQKIMPAYTKTSATSPLNKVFQPNVVWSDKSLPFKGGILKYEFGEGNPAEVMLLSEPYSHKSVRNVTPEVEYRLKIFLSDDNLAELLNKCVHYLNNKSMAANSDIPTSQLPLILNNEDVDIENYLIVDTQTGRKMINADIDTRMNDYLNTLNSPLDKSPLFLECFGNDSAQDFKAIENKFHKLGQAFNN